jgi:hypothetical protein
MAALVGHDIPTVFDLIDVGVVDCQLLQIIVVENKTSNRLLMVLRLNDGTLG